MPEEELVPCMEQLYLLCMVIPFLIPLPKSVFVSLQRKLGARFAEVLDCFGLEKNARHRLTRLLSSCRNEPATEGKLRRGLDSSAPGREREGATTFRRQHRARRRTSLSVWGDAV